MYYKNGQQSQAEILGLSGSYEPIVMSSQCSSPTKYGFRFAVDKEAGFISMAFSEHQKEIDILHRCDSLKIQILFF